MSFRYCERVDPLQLTVGLCVGLGSAARDSDAPRMSDDVSVILNVVHPVISVADAPMTPGATPGEAAVASPGEMEGVVPDEEFPAPCGSVPASDYGVPVPYEESSAPFDDFSSCGRLSAFPCSLSWICAAGSPADVAGTSPGEPAVNSTRGGDTPSSCDASSSVSLL